MKTHTGEKPPKCSDCDIQLTNVNDGNKASHLKNGDKPIQCDVCKLKSKEGTSAKELNCTECNYKCQNSDILNSHLKSHNIFVCNKCNFKGHTAKSLTTHIKCHKQKYFRCSKCDFECTTLTKFNSHKREHTGEEAIIKPVSEIINISNNISTPSTSKANKRELSKSPDAAETIEKVSENISTHKRSKK